MTDLARALRRCPDIAEKLETHGSFGSFAAREELFFLDYETTSEADLELVGAYEYARHPTTRILCAAWRYGSRENIRRRYTKSWSPALERQAPRELVMKLIPTKPRSHFRVAHNTLFEQCITKFVLPRYIENRMYRELIDELTPSDWLCTAAMAAAVALPRNLEDACKAVKLSVEKDKEGRKVMLKLTKPKPAWNKWVRAGRPAAELVKTKKNPEGVLKGGEPAKWHRKMSDLRRVMLYCERDVDADVELFFTIPELSPFERKVWELDQRTNLRGISVDRPLVKKIIGFVEHELTAFEKEIVEISDGAIGSSNEVANIKKFVNDRGIDLENVQAQTVKEVLAQSGLDPVAKRVLQIRQAAAKTSTAKYYAMDARSGSDGRVRDLLMYHGASTGRWTGTGIQIQNFPRGTGRDSEVSAALIHQSDLELIRLLYGDPMDCFSFTLRSAITATEGFEIFCGDYAAIEVRVLFWMAEHAAGVEAYRRSRPLYEEMAQEVYNVDVLAAVTKLQREIGKRLILGAGFGMGWKKFIQTCANFGVLIEAALARRAIKTYREVHSPVKDFWYAMEDAAIRAVKNPGKVFATNKVRWYTRGDFLWCELPSGRPLAYYGPKVRYEEKPWGEMGPVLYHWDIHPKTKQWIFDSTYGGKLVENAVQGTARDLMTRASLRLDHAGYPLLFSVHDELANERELGKGSLEEYTRLMDRVPPWAKGLPLKVETWKGPRYRK